MKDVASALYPDLDQPSIEPEKQLLRALTVHALYSIRLEHQLMKQLDLRCCIAESIT